MAFNISIYKNKKVFITLNNHSTLNGTLKECNSLNTNFMLEYATPIRKLVDYRQGNEVDYISPYIWNNNGKTGYSSSHDILKIKEISTMENTKTEPHQISEPKYKTPVYFDMQNAFPDGQKPGHEECKKILEAILDRPEFFWRTFAFLDKDVVEDTPENREIYFHILQRINVWFIRAMDDAESGTFQNSYFRD